MTRHDLGKELRLTHAELLRVLDGGTVAGTTGGSGVRVTIRMAAPVRKPRKPRAAKPYCRPRELETEFLLPGEARALGRQIRVWSVVSGVPMRTLAREVRTSPGAATLRLGTTGRGRAAGGPGATLGVRADGVRSRLTRLAM